MDDREAEAVTPRMWIYLIGSVVLISSIVGGGLAIRAHFIGVGEKRCESRHTAAEEAALREALKQEKEAPAVASAAEDEVKPKTERRVRQANEANTVTCDAVYPDGVQQAIREAAAAADRVRQEGSPEDRPSDD